MPELKGVIDGISRASSITFDAHKWLSVPMGAGMYLTPKMTAIRDAAGGVVFSGDHDGNFFAADAKTGQKLFQYQTGSAIFAAPTTYAIDNRQYVLIGSGATVTAFALPRKPVS